MNCVFFVILVNLGNTIFPLKTGKFYLTLPDRIFLNDYSLKFFFIFSNEIW